MASAFGDPNEFQIERARAINMYASLEASMAGLFATLMSADSRKSHFVFSRLISPRSKREVLTKLIELNYGDAYDKFFKSLIKRVSELDGPRNRIVHWIAKSILSGDKRFAPPNDHFLTEHPDIFGDTRMFLAEMAAFRERADFLQQLIFYFDQHLKMGRADAVPGPAWPQIFQQQCSYPPPTDHPLVLMHRKPKDPPEPCPGSAPVRQN